MTAQRTLGWVQDAGNFNNLKRILKVMKVGSPENIRMRDILLPKYIVDDELRAKLVSAVSQNSIPYALLKGQGGGLQLTVYDNIRLFGYLQHEAEDIVAKGGRGNAACSGIAQLCLEAQKRLPDGSYKPYQSDWATESFLRWAIALGFIEYNSENDECTLSAKGEQYINTVDGSEEEKDVLIFAMLSYPPVCRVLSLLAESGDYLTKFDIGKRLGFIGEAGFTSIPQAIYVSGYATARSDVERKIIQSNVEGSSDKYARMIGQWLVKLGLAQKREQHVFEEYCGQTYDAIIKDSFIITLKGRTKAKFIRGESRYPRTDKYVSLEMLATKAPGAGYLRNRRAILLKALRTGKEILELETILRDKGYDEGVVSILDDIKNFTNIGLEIRKNGNKYRLCDNIVGLKYSEEEREEKPQALIEKEYVRDKLHHVEHKYLELIDLAYDGKSNLQFEILTVGLLCENGLYQGKHLGGASKPDGGFYNQENGVILDTKAYSEGYSLTINQADEMIRYIEENKQRGTINPNMWWRVFPNNVSQFSYLFVSSFFTGGYQSRINYIKSRTQYDGAVITAKNLLLFVEMILSGIVDKADGLNYLRTNREVIEDDIYLEEEVALAAEPQGRM